MTVIELVLCEYLRRDLHVLLLAARVGEPKVDELDLLVLDHLQNIGGSNHVFLLLRSVRCEGNCSGKAGFRSRTTKSRNYAIKSNPWDTRLQGVEAAL